jgi:DNA-binding SARP family transcriptional activator
MLIPLEGRLWSSRRLVDVRPAIVKLASKRFGGRLDGVMQVRLLGELEVEQNGAAIPSPVSQRPWALFAYLALSRRPVTRSELTARFWPDVLDASARASLRSALWALRRTLGDSLLIDRDRVQVRDAWIDVREFERLAEAGKLEEAIEVCRGELLEGLEDEWALIARQRHRERVIELLEALASASESSGNGRAALAWTRRQAEQDPLDEEVHRRLIRRLADSGDRAGALRTYKSFADRLRRELGVAPSASTRSIAEQIRAEPAAAPTPQASVEPLAQTPIVGRHDELHELLRGWQAATAGTGGAVAVLRGEAGIGKTRLVTELRLRAAAAGALTASCAALDLGGAAPLSLWAELVRELLPALPAPPQDSAWPEDVALLVGELPAHYDRARGASDVLPDLQRTRLFEAVVALVEWAARDQSVLLVLEDIHTADGPSLELSGYVARRVAALPVMLVFTRRDLPRSGDADQIEHAFRARGLLAAEISLGPLAP